MNPLIISSTFFLLMDMIRSGQWKARIGADEEASLLNAEKREKI